MNPETNSTEIILGNIFNEFFQKDRLEFFDISEQELDAVSGGRGGCVDGSLTIER